MAALVCHGRLAADRPAPVHLTEFYFWIAFGGMLGGVFNTLAAPLLFSRIIEYPLVLVLALAARRGRRSEAGSSWSLNDLVVPIGVGALSAGFIVWLHPGRDSAQLFVAGLGLPALARVHAVARPGTICRLRRDDARRRFARGECARRRRSTSAARSSASIASPPTRRIAITRCFTARRCTACRRVDPAHQGEPLTYFHREGPIGQAFAGLPAVAARRDIAVVGLGVGTLASYRTPGQQWTFYEIDPEVERIARTEAYFTYLRSCGDGCRVVLGDARLSLARAPVHGYGLHRPGCVQLRRDPDPPDDDRSAGAVSEPARARRRAGVSHLEPAPGAGAGACPTRAQPRARRPLATAQRQSSDHARAILIRLDGDGRERERSRIAGDRRALEHRRRFPPSTPLWTDDFSNILSVLSLNPR